MEGGSWTRGSVKNLFIRSGSSPFTISSGTGTPGYLSLSIHLQGEALPVPRGAALVLASFTTPFIHVRGLIRRLVVATIIFHRNTRQVSQLIFGVPPPQ